MESLKKATTAYFIYCHLFLDPTKGIIKTIKVPFESLNIHFIDLKTQVKKALDSDTDKSQSNLYKIISLSKTMIAPSFTDSARITPFITNKSDVFCNVELNVVPIKSSVIVSNQDDDLLKYKSITNYSFYEANKQIIKVLVSLQGVDKLPKEQILGKFTETSCEVKVRGLNGSNYIFGVPRLHAKILPDKSEVITSKDNLVIRLRKFKEDDNWSYLHKTKFVGETD